MPRFRRLSFSPRIRAAYRPAEDFLRHSCFYDITTWSGALGHFMPRGRMQAIPLSSIAHAYPRRALKISCLMKRIVTTGLSNESPHFSYFERDAF